jgi:uncharacterized membrane protein
MPMSPRRLALVTLTTLVAWLLLWELWLAPLRPGGSWLALKALPLALALHHALRNSVRARQLIALLLPFYAAEGFVRAYTEHGRGAWCAGIAATLALIALGALLLDARRGALRQDP